MMARMMRALERRAEAGELEALEELATLVDQAKRSLSHGARAAHDGPAHYSWTDIGLTLGITRQAARQLYGREGDPDGA